MQTSPKMLCSCILLIAFRRPRGDKLGGKVAAYTVFRCLILFSNSDVRSLEYFLISGWHREGTLSSLIWPTFKTAENSSTISAVVRNLVSRSLTMLSIAVKNTVFRNTVAALSWAVSSWEVSSWNLFLFFCRLCSLLNWGATSICVAISVASDRSDSHPSLLLRHWYWMPLCQERFFQTG